MTVTLRRIQRNIRTVIDYLRTVVTVVNVQPRPSSLSTNATPRTALPSSTQPPAIGL